MNTLDHSVPYSPTLSDAARRFLEAPRFAVVATLNPDGSPGWQGLNSKPERIKQVAKAAEGIRTT